MRQKSFIAESVLITISVLAFGILVSGALVGIASRERELRINRQPIEPQVKRDEAGCLISSGYALNRQTGGCEKVKDLLPQETRTALNQLLDVELSNHLIDVFVYKHNIDFDNSKTITIWLYAKEEPSISQLEGEGSFLGSKLTAQFPNYYFNFSVFPENSTEIPGKHTYAHTSYYDVIWMGGTVLFPTN